MLNHLRVWLAAIAHRTANTIQPDDDDLWEHLHTAQQIAAARMGLMHRAAHLEQREASGDPEFDHGGFFHHWRDSHEKTADQITARAVALGLEDARD